MDAPLMPPNCGTESCSGPTQTTSPENHELNCMTSVCQETKEKHSTVVEDIRSDNSIPVQKLSVNEHVLIEEHATSATTINTFTDSAVEYPVATMSFNSENLGENSLSATQLGLSFENELEKTDSEKMKVSAENGIEESHPKNAVKRSRGRPRKSSIKSAENAEKMKVSAENGMEKSHPENAIKRSRGRPRKSSIKSAENGIWLQETNAENGIEESHPENAVKRSRGRPRKSSIKSAENGIGVEETNAEKMKVSTENGIEESHPENAVKRSRGRPRKIPIKSAETGIGVEETSAEKMKVSAENGIEESHPENAVKRSRGRPRKIPIKSAENGIGVEETNAEKMKVSAENGMENFPLECTVKKSRGRPRISSIRPTEGKHVLRSFGRARELHLRSQEKCKIPEPSNNVQELSAGASGENMKKKKKQMKDVAINEFSRTRTHLRYLLHRMAYEQNLIDAYSGEGWKGQSAEKLRPEKELQRAKSEIFRCKLKVRNLFQAIDKSIVEGRLPESLFDSKGEIDSEDIFCTKCGLKDVTLENDIILCDGVCERAFHQFCVQPPLLKEYIPSDDEGWLCPGCDCKDDCIDLLNDSQGINLSIFDSWEKVYPEAAAAAAAGKTLDNNLDLPSDDSEDNDYEPIDSEVEEKSKGDESSSDDSDTYSASEDAELAPTNDQNLQHPSDDSEDDDFDPEAAEVDEDTKQQSSGSDFTSDSEDLHVIVDANRSPDENSTTPSELMSGSSKVGRGKRPSLNDELSSLLETDTSQGDSALVSSRRKVGRLDYKKLNDEQYGNVATDSSDDEYFGDTDAPKRRRNNNTESGKVSTRRARKKLKTVSTNNSPIQSSKAPSEPGSSCGDAKSSAARRLGEAATQGLIISFKENQYPERAKKEKLAEELGITIDQVSKWFENARWSFRHSSHLETKLAEIPNKEVQTQQNQKTELGPNDSIDG